MTRRPMRRLLGIVSGILWGAGVAVLTQQAGWWPLDAALGFGAPLAAAFVSSLWAGIGSRRAPAAAGLMVALSLPALGAFQQQGCDVVVDADGPVSLRASTRDSPIALDPDRTEVIAVELVGDVVGERGTVWIEVAGFRVALPQARIGDRRYEINLRENGFFDIGETPGIYHVGGTVDTGCAVDGYVKVAGNPFTSPLGVAGSAAIVLGLTGTLLAGRRPRMPRVASGGSLRRDGQPIQVGLAVLRTPGLDGTVELSSEPAGSAPARQGWTEEAQAVFADHDMQPTAVVELHGTAEWPAARLDTAIVDHLGEPAFSIELPDPGPDHGQVILATDEAGVTTWCFARTDGGALDAIPGKRRRLYHVPRRVAIVDPSGPRALFRAAGAKVLTALAFPLADPLFGRVGREFASRWEAARRPHRLRSFTAADYADPDAPDVDPAQFSGGRTLLFVHGTFSTAAAAFGAMPPDYVADLERLYGGRVVAFEHPTLSVDPEANVRWLLERLPGGCDLDIVAHSRGGLIARLLVERPAEGYPGTEAPNVGKVVFAGTPNRGTILAEPSYVGDLVDSYTNALNFLPGPLVADVFSTVITGVKQIAAGALGGLPGLQAMRPGGPFLEGLNAPSDGRARYFAISGDYEPPLPGWRQHTTNRLVDRIFNEANDLVVPFEGTFGANGSELFPIAERHDFSQEDGVAHSGYFATKAARERILRWLES